MESGAKDPQVIAEPGQDSERGASNAFRVIDRTMHILRCLSDHSAGLTLTELSGTADLHKATVARFLKALERGGFVTVAANKRWRIGPALLDIAARAQRRLDVRDVARPVMEEACRATNETVQMAILADESIAYIEKVEPPEQPLRINTQVGSRRPIHCNGLGKVLAAFHQQPGEIERVLRSAGMQRATPQTITSMSAFQEELARIREKGYAVDDREYNELVTCAAAPVRDSTGRTIAGLSISTIGVSVESARFRELIDVAKESADRVSLALGWNGGAHGDKP